MVSGNDVKSITTIVDGIDPEQKPNKAPSTENKQKPQKSRLPSNWDRCGDDDEDEFGVNLENPHGDNLKKPNFEDDGLVLPKRKAWSRPLAFSQRESILSWIGDDNFVVEDKTTSTHEASFLSLNLHALAEQLAKVDVSGRLFIEADLLATELGSNTSSSQEYDQLQTTGSEASSSHGPDRKPTTQTKATLTISEELAFEDFSEKNKAVIQNTKVFASGLTIGNTDPFSFIQGSDVKGNLNRNQCGNSNQSTAPEPPEQFNVSSAVPKSRLPTFEAEAAESNLYMLPGSLSETKLLDSSCFGSGTLPILEKNAPGTSARS
ncbi:hypothetical protein Peur_028818 [Populus x canadensis]